MKSKLNHKNASSSLYAFGTENHKSDSLTAYQALYTYAWARSQAIRKDVT